MSPEKLGNPTELVIFLFAKVGVNYDIGSWIPCEYSFFEKQEDINCLCRTERQVVWITSRIPASLNLRCGSR